MARINWASRIRKTGDSYAITVPADLISAYKLKLGQILIIQADTEVEKNE